MEYPDWANKKQMKISVSLPTDELGFLGRECPQCNRYFKIKTEKGLQSSELTCPYCSFAGDPRKFITKDQLSYARSKATNEAVEKMIEPMLQSFEQNLKQNFETMSKGFIQIKIEAQHQPMSLPLDVYQEKEVETYVKCDHCSFEFAVYGIFANCPDCKTLNATIMFKKSIEVAQKRLSLLKTAENDFSLKSAILEDALSGGVSSFDAFGKALQIHFPKVFPEKPKNLFQNLDALSKCLQESVGRSLSEIVGKETFDYLQRMFQVRHIFEHNMGVVDDDCIRKVPALSYLKGKKYPLEQKEIEKFLNILLVAGNQIFELTHEKG